MQNVTTADSNQKHKTQNEKALSVHHDIGKTSSTPQSSISSPTKSNETFSELQPRFMTDSSESEEDSVSEVKGLLFIFFFTPTTKRATLSRDRENERAQERKREKESLAVSF